MTLASASAVPMLTLPSLAAVVEHDGDACVSVGGTGRLDCHWLSPCDMAVATGAVLLVHLSLCVFVSLSGSISSSVPLTHICMSAACLSCTAVVCRWLRAASAFATATPAGADAAVTGASRT